MRYPIFLAMCFLPLAAQAETLPWLKQEQSAPAVKSDALPWQQPAKPATVPVQQPAPAARTAPMPVAAGGSTTRELDDRKLNSLASDYYEISPKSKGAYTKLNTLLKRVRDFRKALESRSYEAGDLIGDIKNLEERVEAARNKAKAG